ncbi:uncharacterized protein LOC100900990 [Galendromus occidentalis]|uniref:Uncharacterized protein LOC100900990 n=1 Tax=Galendromus occidentalis TaxID=34638 RepID=A0AAJ6QTH0_9ACAR|nr:uncharacterized protein LOC100900990 [Galendromus occidentalis]
MVNMRCLSILALCFIAVQAQELDPLSFPECVQMSLSEQLASYREEFNNRLGKTLDAASPAAKEIRDVFNQHLTDFARAIYDPIEFSEQRYQECIRNSNGFFDRARCVVLTGRDIANALLPLIIERAGEFGSAVQEIVSNIGTEQSNNTMAQR